MHCSIVYLGHAVAFIYELTSYIEDEEVNEDLVIWRDEGDTEDLYHFPDVSKKPAAVIPCCPWDFLVRELHSDENVCK